MSDIRDMYTFVESKDRKWTGIGLTKEAGFFQGVVYEYGKVSIEEDEESDSASLQFEWNLIDSNGLGKEQFGDEFFDLAGQILEDIIDQQIEEDSVQYVNTDD